MYISFGNAGVPTTFVDIRMQKLFHENCRNKLKSCFRDNSFRVNTITGKPIFFGQIYRIFIVFSYSCDDFWSCLQKSKRHCRMDKNQMPNFRRNLS